MAAFGHSRPYINRKFVAAKRTLTGPRMSFKSLAILSIGKQMILTRVRVMYPQR